MQRITRYVLSELLKMFLVVLGGMTIIFVLGVVAEQAISEGLGVTAVLQLLPYALPMALRFTIPATILFAACSVFGRMSASNEIVAIKSLGIPPLRVLWPALALAAAVSIVALWMNDVAVSWGQVGFQKVIVQSIEQIAYGKLRTQRSYSNGRGLSIHVRDVDERRLIMPTLSWQPPDASEPVVVTADEAELKYDPDAGALVIVFNNMVGDGRNMRLVWRDRFEYRIPISLTSQRNDLQQRPSEIPLGDLENEMLLQQASTEQLQQSMAAEAAYLMTLGEFSSLADVVWAERVMGVRGQVDRLYRLYTEPWRRWATGFSCFFFVLVGAPLAIKMRNSDVWTTFFFCFFPILLFYYPLLMYGVDRAKCGALPPYMVWSGNVVLGVIGLWLLQRVKRN